MLKSAMRDGRTLSCLNVLDSVAVGVQACFDYSEGLGNAFWVFLGSALRINDGEGSSGKRKSLDDGGEGRGLRFGHGESGVSGVRSVC
jgi:hypothetical protein